MKSISMAMLAAATLMAGQVNPAQAINKEWSAVVGFAGGVLVANSWNNYGCRSVNYRQCNYQQPIYVQPACPPQVVYRAPPPRGYYQLQQQMVWQPGMWFYQDMGCGNYRKVWQPGCYKPTTVRVWVPSCNEFAGW